ncbi:hypothetical protein MTO96_012505 [Rhipicephalus appendiculatus]
MLKGSVNVTWTTPNEVNGKLSAFCAANVHPPMPEGRPKLNAVEELMVAPRLPLICIRHLTRSCGQYIIKGQIIHHAHTHEHTRTLADAQTVTPTKRSAWVTWASGIGRNTLLFAVLKVGSLPHTRLFLHVPASGTTHGSPRPGMVLAYHV